MPEAWVVIGLAAALPIAAGASILIVIWMVCKISRKEENMKRKKKKKVGALWPSMQERFEGSITKRVTGLASKDPFELSSLGHSSKAANVWRASFPVKAFLWDEHPSLVADAVEHGWSTFAFTFASIGPLAAPPSPAGGPKVWPDACIRASSLFPESPPSSGLPPPEITWEVNGASCDYMQRIRLNPNALSGSPSKEDHNILPSVQSLQSALPLPGPPLGSLSFPQEGYYEITVYSTDCGRNSFANLSHSSFNENEHAQLIDPCALVKRCRSFAASDALHDALDAVHTRPSSFAISISIDDSNRMGSAMSENGVAPQVLSGDACLKEKAGIDAPALQSAMLEQQICAIGLAAGSAPPFRFPGSDAASIGFFSNGRVFINGQEQKKPDGWRRRIWGPITGSSSTPVVVGCGFDPEARKLFFTLNGDMVEEIMLPLSTINPHANGTKGNITSNKSMDFTAYPLFPTIGANYSVIVTANFGQAAFAYEAANSRRISNPCFQRPHTGPRGAGEDSTDLFSMGHIDSQWLADLGRGGGGASMGFNASPAWGSMPLMRSAAVAAASEPAVSIAEVVEADFSDLFEITLDSRTG